MTLPNFFIVGAPKAGTDELYYQLEQHPQIYMSPLKEPCFFSNEVRVDNFEEDLRPRARAAADSLREYLDGGASSKRFGGIVTSLRDYERLFLRVRNETAIGEGSVCYLWSYSAASVIASTIPHARIIMVLMDPAERAYRQYLKSLSDGNVRHSFRTHLEMALRDKRQKLTVYHPFLEFGNYSEQVRRYLARFPREQIHISFYEDRGIDPTRWFKSIVRFLGVDDSFVPTPVNIPSMPQLPRLKLLARLSLPETKHALGSLLSAPVKSRIKGLLYARDGDPTLAPQDRDVLVKFYRSDILELQRLLDRDLSMWLRS